MLGLLMGALWLGLCWAWLGSHPMLHADALYLSDLLQCLRAGRSLGSWDLPPAPSLFPDLGLLWLLRRATPTLLASLQAYGTLMGAALWLVLARLLRQVFQIPGSLARAYSAAGSIVVLCLCPLGSGLLAWALPGQHGWAFIAALGLWAWTLRQKERPSSFGRSLGLAFGSGLLAQSDPVFWVWAVLPMALLSLRLDRAGHRRLWAMLALGALSAWLAGQALAATGARTASLQWRFLFLRSSEDWAALGAQGPDFLRTHAVLLAVAVLALGLWAWPRPQAHKPLRLLFRVWVPTAFLSLALATLLGSVNGRYLYPLLLLPVALLPLLLAERFQSWGQASLLLPLLLALMSSGAPASQAVAPPGAVQAQSQALDALLADQGLRFGWADYAHARPLRLFSQRGTLCAPMVSAEGRVDPYLWSGERELFMQGDVLTRPQFVVSNGLDPQALRAKLGTAPRTVVVQGLTVWLMTRAGRGARR